ncbi:acyl-CoA thioesterase YbgC [Enhygromyxa salina]|uniref:Acyl-CoA thioesterase YbgC n=1 Tax=Enhygromyxa salina TaxID=215803 RepID=A0A2S9YL47_9BACT|nr:thioesterase family protein [Enhygromyxa salina]PRQ05784.1 acyl-CoA thioesterase YbgC [Enhygromyxa salina]
MNQPNSFPEGFADPEGAAGPVTIRQPVAWGELDALGHVNHTVFLRWLENVRFAWFERVGIAALMRESQGAMGPILARISVDYRAPVGFPDTILANARCAKLGRSSLTLRSRVWSEQQQAIVAEGEVVVVMLDYEGQRSAPIPEVIRAAIRACDGDFVQARD